MGLNLQHAAATLVNMDLPWNPAVWEQRIGRVYRLGQARGVQVVNFIAQGSIEEGMLAVLRFKKSLAAGILDGGEKEVFLNGTRLSKFMESVEEVTGTMGEAEIASDATPPVGAEDLTATEATPEHVPQGQSAGEPAPQDPWGPLLDAGLKLVETLAAGKPADGGTAPARWIETDPETGRAYLKLPVLEPETVQRFAQALGGLLAGLNRR